jgi:hypothetical protein
MESITSAEAAGSGAATTRRRIIVLIKVLAGVVLLAALLYFGSIDFGALSVLFDHPGVVAATALLVLSTLPLSAFRWAMILRVLGAPLPFMPLFHIQCIGMLTNQFLLGPASADAVRGVYVWRALRGRTAVVAASLVADRVIGLLGLVMLAGLIIIARWPALYHLTAFWLLLMPVALGCGAAVCGGLLLVVAPSAIRWLYRPLAQYPRVVALLERAERTLVAVHRRPAILLLALFLAFAGHVVSVVAFILLAESMNIGSMTVGDYATAVPLGFMVNAVPLTAGGLGVGEAVFAQLCRWLEPFATGAPYASIFFAYRAISAVVFLVGLVSLAVYKAEAAPEMPG